MEFRLAELLGSLSLVSDLGMGYPAEHAIESCVIACGLGHKMGLGASDLQDIYYTTLLAHVGCTAGAHEQALVAGGDDIAFRGLGSRVAFGSQRDVFTDFMLRWGVDKPLLSRARSVGRLIVRGEKVGDATSHATCEVASQMARRIGLPESVQRALYEMFERWDGTGLPRQLSGDDISIASRFAQVSTQAALFSRIGGIDLAVETIRKRAGNAFDPDAADLFVLNGPDLLRELAESDVWVSVFDAEPRPHRTASAANLDQVARAFADAVDLKSPFTHGHSAGVAFLADAAAREMSLSESDVSTLRRAGMFHDVGRVGVPNGIWEKPGSLTVGEWEQVRLHPYHSERILSRSPMLMEIAALAGMHHERIDGSGYYRRLSSTAVPITARLLAVADAYQAMTQERPYRPALSPDEAASELATEVEEGRFDADAVQAVLVAAGQRSGKVRLEHPGRLTNREIEVLQLASQGLTNREMGDRLSISPKTVGHHVQHIYDKIGVSTRAAAALYAMEHNLLR